MSKINIVASNTTIGNGQSGSVTIDRNVTELTFVIVFYEDQYFRFWGAVYKMNNGNYAYIQSLGVENNQRLYLLGASGTTLTVQQKLTGGLIKLLTIYY